MPKVKLKMPTTFSDQPKGLVICYLGAGKGKTTAAMGMAVRASGAGMNVYILQFVKAKGAGEDGKKVGEWPVSSEIDFFNALEQYHPLTPSYPKRGDGANGKIGDIYTEQLGLGFVGILGDQKEKAAHIKAAIDGLNRAREVIASGQYQVVILDEIISALESKLIEEQDIIDLVKSKGPLQHLVLTGHNKFPKIIEQCDLVTEMTMIKHPYYKGILAQKGIDY